MTASRRSVTDVSRAAAGDRKLLLILGAVMVVLIVGISVLSPAAEEDARPTTYNSGPQGAKAAFEMLQAQRHATRWEKPVEELGSIDAPRTTLVLAAPEFDNARLPALRSAVKAFLMRGGRVLTTGPGGGLLLSAPVKPPTALVRVCKTMPEGTDALARVGPLQTVNAGQWDDTENPEVHVAQRCGSDAVVVSFAVGAGTAVWWSSASPLTNTGLRHDTSTLTKDLAKSGLDVDTGPLHDANLRLLLASVGEDRAVVFDESLHGEQRSPWDAAKGLPLAWLVVQGTLLFGLLVFSFSRRRGPVRERVTLPRTSPLEFAESMGDLYAKGDATWVNVDAARRRLLQVLVREAGVRRDVAAGVTTDAGVSALADALSERLAGHEDAAKLADEVAAHLRQASEVEHSKLSARSALALVQALSDDAESVRAVTRREMAAGVS